MLCFLHLVEFLLTPRRPMSYATKMKISDISPPADELDCHFKIASSDLCIHFLFRSPTAVCQTDLEDLANCSVSLVAIVVIVPARTSAFSTILSRFGNMLRSSTANDAAYIHDTSRRPYPAAAKYCQSVTVPPISVSF